MAVRLSILAASAAVAVAATAAGAGEIGSGPSDGPIHQQLCPRLESELKAARFRHTCAPTSGVRDSLGRIGRDPLSLGIVPLDLLAHETRGGTELRDITILTRNDARICLFLATRSPGVSTFGEVAARAAKLRFILPPAGSAAATTFAYLQSLDPDGLGAARSVSFAPSAEEAVKQAMSADDIVTLISEWPDTDSPRLRAVLDGDGHFVAFADRALMRQELLGRRVYLPVEVEVAAATWLTASRKVATICSPVVVIAAAQSAVPERDRQDHLDLLATVETIRPEVMVPRDGSIARFVRNTRDLTGASVEELLRLSEEARVKAKPYVEKAIIAGKQAVEAAKPHVEKAKEVGAEALAKAREEWKHLMDRFRRDTAPGKE